MRIDPGDGFIGHMERGKATNWRMTQVAAGCWLCLNDLDEHLIEKSAMVQKADYDIYAAGTKLVTAYDMPALGGGLKRSLITVCRRLKIAEGKTTIPGATNVVRLVRGGRYEGDVIMPAADEVVRNGCLHENTISFNVNNLNGKKWVFSKGEEAFVLLKPVMAGGRLVSGDKIAVWMIFARRLRKIQQA